MENSRENILSPANQSLEIQKEETVARDSFINAMARLIEKYGKIILQDLEDVA